MLKRRLSNPKAVTVVAATAVLAAAIAVAPSFAGSAFLTNQKASKLFLTNKKASGLFLKKKAAGNLYVAKATAPLAPVAGIAAGTAPYGASTTTASYIPTAFTSFAVKGNAPTVITFSANATCTAAKPTADLACPVQILVDGQSTGKVNLAPATAATPTPAYLIHTVTVTTVLLKGGHTIAVQYAGAKSVTFNIKGWNLAAQAYPAAAEAPPTTETTSTK